VGVVSDVEFWRGDRLDPDAGFEFVRRVKQEVPDLPVLIHSAEHENLARAQALGADFIDKNSRSRLEDFRGFLVGQMGFGDFVFRMPDGSEVARARNVQDMADVLKTVPAESLLWHAERNHLSHWMAARTEMVIADRLRPKAVGDFQDVEAIRAFLIDVIREVLDDRQSDVVAQFSARRVSGHRNFLHLGPGSLGGKGRGIAFLRYLLARSKLPSRFPDVRIDVPATVVIGSGEFVTFLEDNGLRRFALECDEPAEIVRRFLAGRLRPSLLEDLRAYVERMNAPVSVRSSSLLEDSHLQPFAGLYRTVMLPNVSDDPTQRLEQLSTAVRLVWASTFGPDPRSYLRTNLHRLEDEEMAVVVQPVVGARHGTRFYPTFSGVAQSYNFYPIAHQKPEDGVVQLALGLGKMVVEGGAVVRVSPAYPEVMPEFGSPKDWLRSSQRQFYALRLDDPPAGWTGDPDATLALFDLASAEHDGELARVGSVYAVDDDTIRDNLRHAGPRLVTFAPILKYDTFPLAAILRDLLPTCRDAMGSQVEIEFAADLAGARPSLILLQIRPWAVRRDRDVVSIDAGARAGAWCRSRHALGNGDRQEIRDVVYLRPGAFDRTQTPAIAQEVGALNRRLSEERRPYLLLGFGRWGSSTPSLGVGVSWAQISNVAAVVETGLPDFQVDPSLGTHFFQNITSLGIPYLSVPVGDAESAIDWDWLERQPALVETKYARHVRFAHPVRIRVDGRSGEAVVERPAGDRAVAAAGS